MTRTARLTVAKGPQRGASHLVPPGRTTIGRGADAGIVLPDQSVSRRHAAVDCHAGQVTLVELGSRNGTWVNREPLPGSRVLHDGDLIRLGSVELTFHAPPTPPSGAAPRAGPSDDTGVSRGELSIAIIFAALTGIVAALFKSVSAWAEGLPGLVGGLAVGAVAATAGIVSMLVLLARDRAMRAKRTRTPQPPGPTRPGPAGPNQPHRPPPPPPYGQPHRPAPRPARRRFSAAAVVVVLLVLCGAGGAAGTVAVRWAIDAVCPQCPQGEDWLVEPAARKTGSLTVTVTEVAVTSKVTKVSLTVAHSGERSLTLVASYSNFTTAGQTFQERTFAGDSEIQAAPQQEVHGVFVYDGVPPRSATEATLSFTRIFSLEVDSLTVGPIPLRAP